MDLDAMVYFPVGYQLPETDQEIRRDILHLISVLAEFTDKSDRVLAMKKFEAPQSVDFPINAYMEVINYYLEQNSYYTEKEPVFKTSDRGSIDWAKTIRKQRPLIQSDGSPVLNDKLARTNNDKNKHLFTAMIAVLKYIDEQTNLKQFYFGTDSFEYVWEKLIDRVYGIKDKYKFFPRTRWYLKGKVKENYALEPDSIMLHNGKIYVLDAKYYRYGITGNPMHLPESSSINKQITYGEYIYTQERFKREYGDDVPVYNAFLMPYNSAKNVFGFDSIYGNIGEAKGDWKVGDHNYERVQGIVVDIRYLMYHYTGNHKSKILRLADTIEQALHDNGQMI